MNAGIPVLPIYHKATWTCLCIQLPILCSPIPNVFHQWGNINSHITMFWIQIGITQPKKQFFYTLYSYQHFHLLSNLSINAINDNFIFFSTNTYITDFTLLSMFIFIAKKKILAIYLQSSATVIKFSVFKKYHPEFQKNSYQFLYN